MKIDYSKKFIKQYRKLPVKTRHQFQNRLVLFKLDQSSSKLHNHQLSGKYSGYYSINVTGDIRALYTWHGSTLVIFAFIGSHSQLYG